MKYNVNSISCTITEDSYENGMSTDTFHSFRFGINEIAINNHNLIGIISKYVDKDITEDDLDIDGNCVNVSTLVAYKPNKDWNEFPIATREEIEKWKLGEMKLYVAEYTFICYNINDEFKLN